LSGLDEIEKDDGGEVDVEKIARRALEAPLGWMR